MSQIVIDFVFSTQHQEQPGTASHEGDMSLKMQMTKQDYSGAVAVIAVVHRPPAGAHPPSGTTRLLSDPKATSGGPTTSPTTATSTDPPITTQHSTHHEQQQSRDQHPVFLHVANVGDCRAVLCRAGTAVAVTQDHTPSLPCEAARVEKAGGFVSRGRVNGILGVSRSFGDIHCKVCSKACCGEDGGSTRFSTPRTDQGIDHDPNLRDYILCRICIVQIQHRRSETLDHADCAVPTRQHE